MWRRRVAATPPSDWRTLVASAEEADGAATEKLATLHAALASMPNASPHLLLDVNFLRCCLRAKAYDVAKAKQLAINYFTFRKRVAWADDASPTSRPVRASSVERELRTGFNLLLPGRDAYGHVVLTQRMELLSSTAGGPTVESQQRAGYYLLHRVLQRTVAQTAGIALVLDFRGFSWRAFARIGLGDMQRGVAMLQDCFPARLGVIYVLHPPTWLRNVVALLRPFLRSDSLQQKFVLCADAEALHEHVPAAMLPAGVEKWDGTASFDWDGLVDGWIAQEAHLERLDPASLLSLSHEERV